ncbi:MAG: nucleotide exchange factor GrpE [Actinomycetota bacterium]|nr:nucleotide exchange factor GrpE [Actinomycetota bacterium]MDA3002493.1 nucleotide exchange factor GrpE [Actinomycetota bacterium]
MPRKEKPQPERDEEPQEPLFTDKRRVDPETGDVRPEAAAAASDELSEDDMALLQEAERDLVAEYRDRAARAEAELQNFRTRVERDRQANRETVIAEVIRSLLPVMDDLDRAEAHGDLAGTPLELVAQKLRSSFERYDIKSVGEVGETFNPAVHEAVVRLPEAGATGETVADVIEGGYTIGERLIRPAKVAVKVPADN